MMFKAVQNFLKNKMMIFVASVLMLLSSVLPVSMAMENIDAAGINKAIRYGIAQSNLGLYSLLGPNWIEAPDGTLLNVYTPFMLLASRVARGGYENPDPSDALLKKIRKRYRKTLRLFTDSRNPAQVKFSVSMYGNSAQFARSLDARIEGIGRGKKFRLKAIKSVHQKFATPLQNPREGEANFEAINSYYFDFKQLRYLDEFRLIVGEREQEPKVTFFVNNNSIL